MVRDMGYGIDLIEISFENSVIVTQRFDEYLLTVDDFQNSDQVKEDMYPDGAFAYTQTTPNSIHFNKAVKFKSMFLKKHRSPNFYNKNDA